MFSPQDVTFLLSKNSGFARLSHAVSEYDSSMLEALDDILRQEGEREIFARHTDQSYTILSTLVNTVVPSYGTRDIWQDLTQGIHDRIATILPADSDSGAEAQPEEGSSQGDAELSQGRLRKVQQLAVRKLAEGLSGIQQFAAKKRDEGLSKQKVQQQQYEEKRIAFLSSIAEGIKRIAVKVEGERLKAFRLSSSDYQSFLQETEDFLQLKNVSYTSVDGVERCESSIYVLSLLYIKNTGNTQLQSLIFNVLKEFLLGFSEYGLDENGARPIHYALSLSGGANEELWLREVIEPLLQKEKQRFAIQGADKSFAEFLTDNTGHDPVRYALSSVHCSAKTVRYVLTNCGTVRRGIELSPEPTLLSRFMADIGYYAFFCSLNECFVSLRKGNLKQHIRFLEECSKDTSKIRGNVHAASEKYSEAKEGMHDASLSARNEFLKVLYLLCLSDSEVHVAMNASAIQGRELNFGAMRFMRSSRFFLDKMSQLADANNDAKDGRLVEEWSTLLNGIGNDDVGVRRAAREFIDHMLKNPGYVRCASTCIYHMKAGKTNSNRIGGMSAARIISPFFPLAHYMCHVTERFFQCIQTESKKKHKVLKCLHEAKRDHTVFVAIAVALIVSFTIGVIVAIGANNSMQDHVRILCFFLVFAVSGLVTIALWVHDINFRREVGSTASSNGAILRDIVESFLDESKCQQPTCEAGEQRPVSTAVLQADLPATRVLGGVPAGSSNSFGVSV